MRAWLRSLSYHALEIQQVWVPRDASFRWHLTDAWLDARRKLHYTVVHVAQE
jgi:hypothetical protein